MLFAGKYELGEVVGEGSMGIVHRARHVQLELDMAIKILHPRYAADPTFRARFSREARVVHAFVHKRSVMLRDFGDAGDGTLYLTMDFCPGVPLSELLEAEGRLAPRRAVAIADQVLDLLEEAHSAGFLHRDIKPDNIMIDPSPEGDQVKVMDFGIAKIMEGDSTEADLTRGNALGTPLYMSPEQASGEKLDGRSDIYSLGVVLFESITGSPPFRADSIQALLMKHLTQPPPLLPKLNGGDEDAALQAILHRILAKRPEDRFSSATELRRTLRSYLAGDFRSLISELSPYPDRKDESFVSVGRSVGEQAVQRRLVADTLGALPVSPQEELEEPGGSDTLERAISAVKPARESSTAGGGSGQVSLLARRVSPAREAWMGRDAAPHGVSDPAGVSLLKTENGSSSPRAGDHAGQEGVDPNGVTTWVASSPGAPISVTDDSDGGAPSPIPPDHNREAEEHSMEFAATEPALEAMQAYAAEVARDADAGSRQEAASRWPPDRADGPNADGRPGGLNDCMLDRSDAIELPSHPDAVSHSSVLHLGDEAGALGPEPPDDTFVPPRHRLRNTVAFLIAIALVLAGVGALAATYFQYRGYLSDPIDTFLAQNPEFAAHFKEIFGFSVGEGSTGEETTDTNPETTKGGEPARKGENGKASRGSGLVGKKTGTAGDAALTAGASEAVRIGAEINCHYHTYLYRERSLPPPIFV